MSQTTTGKKKRGRGRPPGSLNRKKTAAYHLNMMQNTAKALERVTGKAIYLPHEHWLLVMNDETAEPSRRDAAAMALQEYTYTKPAPEPEQAAEQGTLFAWMDDAPHSDSVPAATTATPGSRAH